MKYLPYVLKHLKRNWVRTGSTVVAMSICIFLFCTLQTLIRAVTFNLKSANANILVMRHAVSLVFNLPIAYKERIASVPGVTRVGIANWFFGFRDPNTPADFFPNFAVDERFLEMYPEYLIPPDQKQAYLQDRRGCIIARKLSEQHGWKIGDIFQLESIIPPYRVGRPFEFVVRAIYDTDERRHPGTVDNLMFFHYEYLYEMTRQRAGIGTYRIQIADPSQAGAISKAVDALFENSDAQTHTETEAAFRAGFVSLAGNLAYLLNAIGLAVTFTILLVTANTMSMAVRERRTEIAVLKTLGFPSGLVMGLILSESAALGALGGGLALGLSSVAIGNLTKLPFIGDAVRGFPDLGLHPVVAMLGFGLAVALGLTAGFIPALLAFRARITDLLRGA
jgi:putative ABC transport system permease protein